MMKLISNDEVDKLKLNNDEVEYLNNDIKALRKRKE